MASQKELDHWFRYHPPTPEQLKAYEVIRASAKMFAEDVNANVPDSADKTVAIRKIRESVMAANLAVACNTPDAAPTSGLAPHQQRVVDEKAALDDKIRKLSAFVGGTIFAGLADAERSRLSIQLQHMNGYSEIMSQRIAAF